MPKVTIQSMARELGLSRNTVAMALKGDSAVSETTRRRVRAFAERLGYTNMAAGKEPCREYRIMAVKKPDKAAYWDKVINGIAEEASLNHCIVTVAVVTEEEAERKLLPAGYGEDVDALLFINIYPDDYVAMLQRDGKIGIFLDGKAQSGYEPAAGDLIKSEGIKSIRCITERLIRQGLRKIAYLSSPQMEYETLRDRLTGYQQAMERHGLPMTTVRDVTRWAGCDIYDPKTLEKILDSWEEMPEAFVCGNDEIARRLTVLLRERGLRVPEDVAVTGFDDDEELSVAPFLTTVNPDAKWLGRRMVRQMLWRLSHPDAYHETVLVESRVIFRQSSEKYAEYDTTANT